MAERLNNILVYAISTRDVPPLVEVVQVQITKKWLVVYNGEPVRTNKYPEAIRYAVFTNESNAVRFARKRFGGKQ